MKRAVPLFAISVQKVAQRICSQPEASVFDVLAADHHMAGRWVRTESGQRRSRVALKKRFDVGSIGYCLELTDCQSVVLKAIADRRAWPQRAAPFVDSFWYPGCEDRHGEPASIEVLHAHRNAHAVLRIAAETVIGWVLGRHLGQICFRSLDHRLHRILLSYARRQLRQSRLAYDVENYDGWVFVTRRPSECAA